MKSHSEKKILGGLGLASVLIAGVTFVYHYSTERLVESAGRVSESHALIATLNNFASHIQTVRMSTRGYIVTGKDEIKSAYDSSSVQAQEALELLRKQAVGMNERHQQAITEIDRLGTERLTRAEYLINLRHDFGRLVAGPVSWQSFKDDLEDPLRGLTEQLIRETSQELHAREELSRQRSTAMGWLLLLGAMVEVGFVAIVAGVIRVHIRDRAKATEKILQNEATLRGFYESGATMMGIIEVLEAENDAIFISANSSTYKLFPNHKHVEGRRATELGSPREVIDLFLRSFRQAQLEQAPVTFEYERKTVDGRRWLMVVVCPIAGNWPRPRFSYVIIDKTAKKQAEAALRQHVADLAVAKDVLEKQSAALEIARAAADSANQAKSVFLTNMSHEIRTPLTAVLGYADLLAERPRDDEQRVEWVGVIRRNARHLLELINDILDLSKIEAGKMTMQSVPCDPGQVVSDVCSMLRPRAEQKGVALRLEIEPPLPEQMGTDPLRLRQVLLNLVGNAIKFTDAGEVCVRVWCDEGDDDCVDRRLHISVRDTGIGMSPQQVGVLFQPFTQADTSMARRFGGTGLGLSISQRLVTLLGGTVEVQSEPGIGSTFTVSLPIRAATSDVDESGTLLHGQTDPIALSGRVMIVEDTPDSLRLLSIVLAGAGAEVIAATDGKTAIEKYTREKPDLILMDVQLPGMDGCAATREIRRRGFSGPVVAITSHATSEDRERCIAAGFSEYLTKPVDVPLLLTTLARHLQPIVRSKVA